MPKIRIKEPHLDTQTFSLKLSRKLINIGRHNDCMISLEDDSISSEHAVIKRVSGGFLLCDKDSTNGTKIEGKRYIVIDLNRTRHFNLGDVQVSFLLSEEELSELKQESFESQEQLKEKIEPEEEAENLKSEGNKEDGEPESNLNKEKKDKGAENQQEKEDVEIELEGEQEEQGSSSSKSLRRKRSSNQGGLPDLVLMALSFCITLGVLLLLFYLIVD